VIWGSRTLVAQNPAFQQWMYVPVRRMIETIHALTIRSGAWQETTGLVGKLNRALRGRANYFDVGSVSRDPGRHRRTW
jgi:phage tail sheath protein FI